MRPTYAEIDLTAIRHNVAAIRTAVSPSRLCVVVKADGYGHGDVPVAEAALEAGADQVAVALVEEGIRLREAGITGPILVLSESAVGDVGELLAWGLTPTAYRPHYVAALHAAADGPVDVHVKVDTGMHRVGASPDQLAEVLEAIRPPLRLAAIWTHFAVADEDPEYTAYQIRLFEEVVGDRPVPAHLANTAGALLHPDARRDMVRVGLGTYGLHPCPETRHLVELTPAMRIVSRVSHVQRLAAGERPSYGRRRPLPVDASVATVPIGYADGFPRRLSEVGGEVLIGGKRRPLAGTVTMDQIVVEVGDEVVLLGTQGSEEITADEWAQRLGTISYEVVCGIGPRVTRRYRE